MTRVFSKLFRPLDSGLKLAGLDVPRLCCFLTGLPGYLSDLSRFRKMSQSRGGEFPFGTFVPCLHYRAQEAGVASGEYFYQDLWAAQKIFAARPTKHVDVGSRIDGFVAHVAAFREIEVIDIRPLRTAALNIRFRQCDLVKIDPTLLDCCDSLSCLNVLEHIGLGRYGDSLDCDGHIRAWENLYRMLKAGGTFYFSVPIGPLRVDFNAHRVFSLAYLAKMFSEKYELVDFAFVNDSGDMVSQVKLDADAIRTNAGCNFGCGLFELRKVSPEDSSSA